MTSLNFKGAKASLGETLPLKILPKCYTDTKTFVSTHFRFNCSQTGEMCVNFAPKIFAVS